jgi:hypothetical protein
LGENIGALDVWQALFQASVIETTGRLTKIPYWKCLDISAETPDVRSEIYDWYYNLVVDRLIVKYFQVQLRNRNFYAGPIDDNAKSTEGAVTPDSGKEAWRASGGWPAR